LYPAFYFPFIIGYFIFIYLFITSKKTATSPKIEKKAGREMDKILEKLEERKK
jgi:hypothetical protein